MATKKVPTKKPKTTTSGKARTIARPTYKSFKLQKRIKHPAPKLPGAFKLLRSSFRTVFKHWRIFIPLIGIYLLLTAVIAGGLNTSVDVEDSKDVLDEIFTGGVIDTFNTSLTLFTLLIGSAGAEANTAYQSVIAIIISLASIWGLRQVLAGQPALVRDVFYKSMYPLVPFLLVLVVIGLELLPAVVGSFLYGTVFNSGLAITGAEQFVWALVIFMLVLLTLYMLASSIFALYIVTLPEMRPMMALRSARELVRYRRWTVIRKLVFVPVTLVLLLGIVTIPAILLIPATAHLVFVCMSVFTLILGHAYIYTLYRELL